MRQYISIRLQINIKNKWTMWSIVISQCATHHKVLIKVLIMDIADRDINANDLDRNDL